jgi:beta-phosphoglucomutase-like phosphatase (HAD superfamily)
MGAELRPIPEPRWTASVALPGLYRAVVFDLDGLLLDTEPLWERAEAKLIGRRGFTYTHADALATRGKSIDDAVRTYGSRMGIPADELPSLRTELIEIVGDGYERPLPCPGALELVAALRERVPLAVASNTDRELVTRALGAVGLTEAFAVVVTADIVGRAKPAPDVYLRACQELGVQPVDAIAFEDSETGVRAAKAAGLYCVLVPSDPPGASTADVILRSLEDVTVHRGRPPGLWQGIEGATS